jgi:hypothetical protein
MIKHGTYKIVDFDFKADALLEQNNILKKKNSNLTTLLAISLIVTVVVIVYMVDKDLRKNQEFDE